MHQYPLLWRWQIAGPLNLSGHSTEYWWEGQLPKQHICLATSRLNIATDSQQHAQAGQDLLHEDPQLVKIVLD